MRKVIGIGVGAVAAVGVAVAPFGHGVAAAVPDVSGQTYGKVKQALSGFNLVVASRVGDRQDEDSCIVDRAQEAQFLSGTGTPAQGTIYIYLNCYGNIASTTSPGYSSQNPMGKKAQQAQAAQSGG